MSKKITQKIKELLSTEDLKIFESAIQTKISDTVATKVTEQVALKEDELKKEFQTLSEEFCKKEVASRLETEKAKLIEGYDKTLVNLETKIVSRLDSFLESTIVEQISDEMLEKVAIQESLMPLVGSLKEAFAKHHIELDSSGEKAIKELKEDKDKVEQELTESISKNMKYEKRLETAANFVLISQKSEGLNESQKTKVLGMFKDKKFEEVEKKIDDYVHILKEGTSLKPKKKTKIVETKKKKVSTVISESDNIVPKQKKVNKDEGLDTPKPLSMANLANDFMSTI
tara:strand:- start:18103 stop:18960 length:858 start_codon:yes stop_codon:yes gene_type:complete